MQIDTSAQRPRLTAVLGPTNTGKTHLTMERMLGHETGMIGFPLRLLARENYDRAVKAKGSSRVALITGEEKIVPAGAQYFMCTVESMPVTRRVAFLGVDEIQMCADPDRGHIFTDRLLHARGEHETMFMGAATIKPLIRELLPDCQFDSRARFSTLRYTGPKKINRLPARSATVAFSAADVYAIAELLRRQRGGAAVVLGALSPRTRNAQVAMYQAGEVDYLVATDAIGMGLNMDVDHVAFAATRKFDGRAPRRLRPSELAQIAGRAGRHMNDGTFGTTAEIGPLDEEEVDAIENHRFKPLRTLFWRNVELQYATLDLLRASLAEAPDLPGLVRARAADDELALVELCNDGEIVDRAAGPDEIRLLWDVCRIPDFGRVMSEGHARLLAAIYRHLTGPEKRLPEDWMASQVDRVARTDGDIEALSQRISNIRTWTYVSFQGNWLHEAAFWQIRTREVEDTLSDALHNRLTQRFVDRRTSVLVRRMKERDKLLAAVSPSGEVTIEGHFVGRLEGFRFAPDAGEDAPTGEAARSIAGASLKALEGEIAARVGRLERGPDFTIELDDVGRVLWHKEAVARLTSGPDALKPEVRVLDSDLLDAAARARIRKRLSDWLTKHVAAVLEPLVLLRDAELPAPARGIAFRLVEALGSMPRRFIAQEVKALSQPDRQALRQLGVRLGRVSVYIPALIKPAAAALRGALWCLQENDGKFLTPPPAGRVSFAYDDKIPKKFYEAVGYRASGVLVVRIDILERLAGMAWTGAQNEPFLAGPDFLSLAGCGAEEMKGTMRSLGYKPIEVEKVAEPEPQPEASAEATAEPEAAQESDTPAAPDAEPAPETATEPALEPSAETASESAAEAAPEPAAEAAPEIAPAVESTPDTEPASEAPAETAPEPAVEAPAETLSLIHI